MRPRHPLLLALLLALTACGDDAPGSGPEKERFELRPRWTGGEIYDVREWSETRGGMGSFPPAGSIEERTTQVESEESISRLMVVEADGHRLLRAEQEFLSSVRRVTGVVTRTARDGKTLLISQPFGMSPFIQVKEDGPPAPASEEMVMQVRRSLLRSCASLLPSDRVSVGERWMPGRKMDTAVPGQGPARASVTFEAVEEVEGTKVARLVSRVRIPIVNGPLAGSEVLMRETVLVNLTTSTDIDYHGVTEWYIPDREEEGWRRVESTLTMSPVGN
jgi:hypothetical protein